MRTIRSWGTAALLLVSLACRGSRVSAPPPLGTPRAALRKLAMVPSFRPPADGLLTENMIDRYLQVRRAAKGRSEEEAARSLRVDVDEFAWVHGRILEAVVALDTRRWRSASDETYAHAIASLKQARDGIRDKESSKRLNEQIGALEKERASLKSLETLPAEIAANARRVASRRAEIEAAGL
ncbi:MAG TPA: hypothetical protein VK780_05530 [Thermoanaerobaculia bacterium]|nr:hypothetical protein [Thermoanaerobaculia bacterium]